MSVPPTADPATVTPRAGARARVLRGVRLVLTIGAVLVLVPGVIGHTVRDRSVPLALLSYIPLVPVGLAAAVLDLAFLGRCLPRPRFTLTLAGLAAAAWSAALLTGTGPAAEPPSGRPEARLLHWNVHWGGGKHRSAATWAALKADIRARSPDVVVLSEAPPDGWLAELAESEGWSFVGCGHAPGDTYWYRLYVFARGPVRMEWDRPVPNGHIMSVVVTLQGRPVRVLVADGESDPRLSRVALLDAVTETCREGRRKGEPIDIVAGDFNTPGRSTGFDGLSADGYRLASRSARGWRGTFPASCPLYDIDHVWLADGFRPRGCELFGSPASDHRGQLVVFELPAPE